MKPKLRLGKIHIWERDGPVCKHEGWTMNQAEWWNGESDGFVIYEVEPIRPELGGPTYTYQPFARGPTRNTGTGNILWSWDGNIEAPTLTPSFKSFGSVGDWPMVHLYMKNGKIDLLGDSEAEL